MLCFNVFAARHARLYAAVLSRWADFAEHYKRGILLEPQGLPLAGAMMPPPPGLAAVGTRFKVALAEGEQTLRVTRVLDDGPQFQRVAFESLEVPH